MIMRKLHHLALSPFCRKVRLVLAEKKLEVELIDEPVWEKRLDFIRFSPSGKVPLLKEGLSVFTESTPICEYLDECYPIPKLIPADQKLRFETRRITCWFDDKFYNEVTKNLLNERIYKKIFKTGQPDRGAIKEGLRKIKFHFDYLEWLLEKRNWLAGEKMSLADFSAAGHISSLDYIGDIDWQSKPTIKEWYAKIKSRPAFRNAGLLADLVPGFVPTSHYSDLDF